MWHLPQILEKRGYQVQLRGVVPVKGKGDMETYYVMGRKAGHAPGFARQPSTYSSLATVVYGMLQARRRQTIKKSSTRELHLRLMNELTFIVSICKIQLDCHCTFWTKILFCSLVTLSPTVPAVSVWLDSLLGQPPAVPAVPVWWDSLLGLQPAVTAVSVWWDSLLGLQPAVPAVPLWWDSTLELQPVVLTPDDWQVWKTGAKINGSGKLNYSPRKRLDWMPLLSITNPTWPALVSNLIQLKLPAIQNLAASDCL